MANENVAKRKLCLSKLLSMDYIMIGRFKINEDFIIWWETKVIMHYPKFEISAGLSQTCTLLKALKCGNSNEKN